jgi:glutathione peroxidase
VFDRYRAIARCFDGSGDASAVAGGGNATRSPVSPYNANIMFPLIAATALTMTLGEPASIYNFKVKNIDGKEVALKEYKGKVLLVVNVASKCGLTPQYKGLQALYEEKKKDGLVVLGFPANNFGAQEPGTEGEIKEFCSLNYGVKFPMFSKISVKGDDTHPLYKWLIAHSDRPQDEIEWNFAKFVVARDGKSVTRLTPRDVPDSESVRKAVDAALAKK